jgi:hypothetical protein
VYNNKIHWGRLGAKTVTVTDGNTEGQGSEELLDFFSRIKKKLFILSLKEGN